MDDSEILTVKEAAKWVSKKFDRKVNASNISYLVQYGQIRKINGSSEVKVYIQDLIDYYSNQTTKEVEWKNALGEDLDWHLSFDKVKESERTKHVHRLHPYKGKFIPQLVEYFLDDHVDEFKTDIYFHKGDIVLDPFCGSGTTLVQANELGLHSIGIDISEFNTLISNTKVQKHDLLELHNAVRNITIALKNFVSDKPWGEFENELLIELSKFNNRYFSSPEFVFKVRKGEIEERYYSREKEKEFLPTFVKLVEKYNIKLIQDNKENTFLTKWYFYPVMQEIEFVKHLIDKVQNFDTREILYIILSRTIRSSRATTHADLATLIEPVNSTYYCHKHYKICKPLFSIVSWWDFYSRDTIKRLGIFEKIKTDTHQICLTGDSRTINIFQALDEKEKSLSSLARDIKIHGIFSSPPYVGLIDYHEQHAYAYELFGLDRRDDSEIGPLFKGKGMEARSSYIKGISEVLINCKKYFVDDYDVLLVANDSYNLYTEIANKAGMKIIKEFKRPVLNRTEKDKSAYSEKIFCLKEK